jgi:hypothetical protein
MYLPGYAPGAAGSEVYVRQDRPGAPWVASDLPGDVPEQSARDPHTLLAKVARLYGITGTGTVTDERENARRNLSGTRALTPGAAPVKAAPPVRAALQASTGVPTRQNTDGTTRIGGLREGQQWVTPSGRVVDNPSQQDIIQGKVKLQQPPAAPAGTGPGNVPIGATDAERRAIRPRIEGESDFALSVRTAPSRFAAESLLKGHALAGLRAIARREGVVVRSSDTKPMLVERLMRALHDRHADSNAITDMVNRDRTPATPAKVAPATPSARPGLESMPLATRRTSGREPLVDTVARIRERVASGEITRDQGAAHVAQLVQRFSVSQGDPEKDAISAELVRIAQEIRGAPRPTMTGAQLIAARRKLQAEQQGGNRR